MKKVYNPRFTKIIVFESINGGFGVCGHEANITGTVHAFGWFRTIKAANKKCESTIAKYGVIG